MSFCDLPVELVLDILSFTLYEHSQPTDLLTVNKLFAQLALRILHAQLHFRTIQQLISFAEQTTLLTCHPKSLSLTLPGGAANFDVFKHLAAALQRCGITETSQKDSVRVGPVLLDELYLCLHSHSRCMNLDYINKALSRISPRSFTWTGPDPDHHFSTAIVPSATLHLFGALPQWSRIEHITLTNLSFPSDDLGVHGPLPRAAPLLPHIPSLRTLYLGQATFLPPSAVALMVCDPAKGSLESVRLVDAYRESIWGSRIRRRDVEKAALALREEFPGILVERVQQLVRCEAKNERIMGGDRVEEGTTSLE